MRWSVILLLFFLASSRAIFADTVWSDEQMEQLEALIQQAEQENSQQQLVLSDLRTQLQEQSSIMRQQERQLKVYKTLLIVSGGAILGILSYDLLTSR